jgi:signal transduction histidine kinase
LYCYVLANTSHEIRTPLNAIIAGSELLSEIPGMTGEQVELNSMVVRASHTLLAIVSVGDDCLPTVYPVHQLNKLA